MTIIYMNRKYYKLSEFGLDAYSKLTVAWNNLNRSINILIEEEGDND